MKKFIFAVFIIIASGAYGIPVLRISYPLTEEGQKPRIQIPVQPGELMALIAPESSFLSAPLFPSDDYKGMRKSSIQILLTLDSLVIYERIQTLREAYRPLINTEDIPLHRFPFVSGIVSSKDSPPETGGFLPLISTIAVTIPMRF